VRRYTAQGVDAELETIRLERDIARRELNQARVQLRQAHRALLAEFVPDVEHDKHETLWSAVEAACAHHEEHHDREDALRRALEARDDANEKPDFKE
jgi:hypothetical protein